MSEVNQYNATAPSLTDGQIRRVNEVDAANNIKVNIATKLDRFNDDVKAYPPVATVTRITTAATTVVSAVPCWVRATVQGGTMGLVTIYDNSAASGTVEYAETPAAKDKPFADYTYFTTGCTVVTAAATTIVVETITVS